MSVAVGKKVPSFALPRSDGTPWKLADALSDRKDGKLVIYFYPKDMTPGCTLEGQDFRDLHAEGVAVPDDVAVALEACAHELVPGPLLGPSVAAAVLGELPDLPDGPIGIAWDGLLWDAPSATHVLVDVGSGIDAGSWRLLPRDAVEVTTTTGLDLTRRQGAEQNQYLTFAEPVTVKLDGKVYRIEPQQR